MNPILECKLLSVWNIMAKYRDLAIWFLLTSAITSIFLYIPRIDMQFSTLFFDISTANFMVDSTIVKFANIMPIIILTIFIFYIGLDGIKKFALTRSINPKHYFMHIYTFSTLVVARVFIYWLVKPMYCRARPYIIHEFGGVEVFNPVFQINYAKIPCSDLYHSFVSGHAAAVFSLYCMLFVIGNFKLRVVVFGVVTISGMIAGWGRVAIGQHFLSDIVYALLLSYFIARVLDIFLRCIYNRWCGQ